MRAAETETRTRTDLVALPMDESRGMDELFDEVAHLPYSCFLDSSLLMPGYGRYSFIGFDPYLVVETRGPRALLRHRDGGDEERDIDPFEALRGVLAARTTDGRGIPFPFTGGGIGYLAYELGRYIERLPASAVDDLGLPELAFCFYDRIVARDGLSGETTLILCPGEGGDASRIEQETYAMLERGSGAGLPGGPPQSSDTQVEFECGFTLDEYIDSVRKVKEYILAGDIYQANLSQRFSAPLLEPAWRLYKRLRRVNAAPFSAYLNFGEFAVASSSPERFLKVDGRDVETRPIKGTRRRSSDPREDGRLKRELAGSAKDMAELSMIVDLERNDLGRVCDYGSVKVEEHAVMESYATVHHLVSTVTGRLFGGHDVVDLLKGTFPGGSITGAPKIRSMEIIDELEPTARSVYTGSIGYLGFDGRHDLNIAIRTMIITGGRVYSQVGGGIVADSDPEDEFQETLDKGKAMFEAVTGQGGR